MILAAALAPGLVAPPHALSQSGQPLILQSGDVVSVSGAGTVGTIGGVAVSNATTSYTDTNSGFARAVSTNGTAMFTLGAGGSLFDTKNGAGELAEGSGLVTITGGSISSTGANSAGIFVMGSGPVMISGGAITGGQSGLTTTGSGSITISGGTLSSAAKNGVGLIANGSGPLTISGGTLSATGQSGRALEAMTGQVMITGGAFITGSATQGGTGVLAFGSSVVTIAGGSTFQGIYGFEASDTGIINLFSQNDTPFLVNGVSMNNMALASNTSGTISGTLEDGEILNSSFFNAGTINLNVGTPPTLAPEPSEWVSLGLGALGLTGLIFKARKRSRFSAPISARLCCRRC